MQGNSRRWYAVLSNEKTRLSNEKTRIAKAVRVLARSDLEKAAAVGAPQCVRNQLFIFFRLLIQLSGKSSEFGVFKPICWAMSPMKALQL